MENARLALVAVSPLPGPLPDLRYRVAVTGTVGSGSQFAVTGSKTRYRGYIGSYSQFTVTGQTSLYKREYTLIHGDTLLHFEKNYPDRKGGKIR